MGFFKRGSDGAPRGARPCPICGELLTKDQMKAFGGHFETHVRRIEQGEGAGGFTFTCACGPADMYWNEEFKAVAGIAVHLMEKHGIDIMT